MENIDDLDIWKGFESNIHVSDNHTSNSSNIFLKKIQSLHVFSYC